MAAYDIALPGISSNLLPLQKVGEGVAAPSFRLFFVQRAWNLTWLAFETWVSEDEPNPTPPSGEPISGLVTSGTWKEVV